MNKETSPRVSQIASRLIHISPATILQAQERGENALNDLCEEVQALAGSALSQDETPAEFNDADIAADPILHFFHYAHLPPILQETSKEFFLLAFRIVCTIPRTPERTVSLRKLLEAKDAAVRANLPAPKLGGQRELDEPAKPFAREVGEPVEVGGHDEDRDGPIPFDG